jgi:hypothetical protein
VPVADAGEHGGDMAVLVVERRPALGVQVRAERRRSIVETEFGWPSAVPAREAQAVM